MAESSNSTSVDTRVEARSSFDIATYVAARAFNSAALPAGMPDWQKLAIEARADKLREIAKNDFAFDELSEAGAKEKRRKDAGETAEAQLGLIMQEQQRERGEWARTSHSFGNATMTGKEWSEVGQNLKRSSALRDWLIAQLMSDGRTRAEAETKVTQIADIAAIMAKPESQRTPAEQAKMHQAERDPEIRHYVEMTADYSQQSRDPTSSRDARLSSGDSVQSVLADSDELASFATAPDLRTEFRTADAAVVSKDRPRVAPPQSIAETPPRVLASGFEV